MVRRLVWLGFLLRVMVSFWNAFFGPSIGAGGDAVGFHDIAVEFSRTFRPNPFHFGVVYSYGLGVLYRLTYPSLFLGGVFSAIAWLASAYVLLHIMRLLEFRGRQRTLVMAVFALYPSSILWTGVTLREAYQLLAVNVAVYASVRIYLDSTLRHWALLVAAVLIGGILQVGIFALGLFIVTATTAALLLKRVRFGLAEFAVLVPIVVLAGWLGAVLFLRLYDFTGEGIAAAIESYQRGGLSIWARTHYKTTVDIDGPSGLIGFVLGGFFQYLFEPMPWRPLTLIDVPTVFENLLRAALLGQALIALMAGSRRRRTSLALVFGSYLILELLFSLGTVNWGTAARHHVPSIGLLLVCAFARLRRRVKETALDPSAEHLVPAQAASA